MKLKPKPKPTRSIFDDWEISQDAAPEVAPKAQAKPKAAPKPKPAGTSQTVYGITVEGYIWEATGQRTGNKFVAKMPASAIRGLPSPTQRTFYAAGSAPAGKLNFYDTLKDARKANAAMLGKRIKATQQAQAAAKGKRAIASLKQQAAMLGTRRFRAGKEKPSSLRDLIAAGFALL